MLVRTNTGGVICFPSNFMYPHGVREVVGALDTQSLLGLDDHT